mmetsp:Transcript_98475/g.306637  ORF Transcript_98475/g.306637 Transcript_98475/m.306637 type:complete len:203 (-) Transcript_98475:194-802(-)
MDAASRKASASLAAAQWNVGTALGKHAGASEQEGTPQTWAARRAAGLSRLASSSFASATRSASLHRCVRLASWPLSSSIVLSRVWSLRSEYSRCSEALCSTTRKRDRSSFVLVSQSSPDRLCSGSRGWACKAGSPLGSVQVPTLRTSPVPSCWPPGCGEVPALPRGLVGVPKIQCQHKLAHCQPNLINNQSRCMAISSGTKM